MNGSDDGIHTVDAIRAAHAADTSRPAISGLEGGTTSDEIAVFAMIGA